VRRRVARRFEERSRVLRPLFDAAFYLRQFPKIRQRGVSRAPLLHYLLIGWKENRPPRPDFDPIYYRQSNPDLQADDVLWHYAQTGMRRGGARNEVMRQAASRPWLDGRPAVLTIHHGRGGGSSRFLDLFEQDLWNQGYNLLRLRAVNGSPSLAVIEDIGEAEGATSEVFDLATERGRLAAFAVRKRVTRLIVNHLIDRPLAITSWIEDLADRLSCSYDVVLHDYYLLCPRVDMVNGEGRFCGVAPPSTCVRCVASAGSEVPRVDASHWRSSFSRFLARAEAVFVPSADTARRMSAHITGRLQVVPPEKDNDLPAERLPRIGSGEVFRIAVLGALNVPKGLNVVVSVARAAREVGAPVAFSVLGPASDPEALEKQNVVVTGSYLPDQLEHLIERSAPHVVFLPAIWPETWSFVLTAALRRGLLVIAFDIGAPAERLRALSRGRVLALDLAERPDELLAAFLEMRERFVEP
jgi:glycosyltransferase involved in cell wall biosynthesis